MINEKEKVEFLNALLHGWNYGFETCRLISEALSYPRSIPKDFWLDESKGYYGILGFSHISKKEMRNLKESVIEAITHEITLMENGNSKHNCTQIDNFSRLFHALAILGVDKKTFLVPATGKNLLYNTAYWLWGLDDGSDSTWKIIGNTAWYASAVAKGSSGDNLITGFRHDS